jgi:hypothetical protein
MGGRPAFVQICWIEKNLHERFQTFRGAIPHVLRSHPKKVTQHPIWPAV